MMVSFLLNLLLILSVASLGIGLVLYHPVRKTLRRRKELMEKPANGLIQEPHPIRELTQMEKEILFEQKKSDNFFYKLFLFGLVSLLIYAVFYWLYLLRTSFTTFSVGLIITAVLNLILLPFARRRELNHVDLDLKDKVYQLSGQVYKQRSFLNRRYPQHFITVRGVEFDLKYNQSQYDLVHQDEITQIEYSPRTRHIWKITEL